MEKILAYAYLLGIAALAMTYGQSHLPQSVQAFISYQSMRIESLFGARSGDQVGAVEAPQFGAMSRTR
jgi:hypothetical protein